MSLERDRLERERVERDRLVLGGLPTFPGVFFLVFKDRFGLPISEDARFQKLFAVHFDDVLASFHVSILAAPAGQNNDIAEKANR